ncbi:iron-containing alcohol dehydrogenase [[Eubacterium] cellulosolvens]
MSETAKAEEMLRKWKGDKYTFGTDVLQKVGEYAKEYGSKTILCHSHREWVQSSVKKIKKALEAKEVRYQSVLGARENAPREDLYRISLHIAKFQPDSIIPIGGGSTIDACKAASVLASYSPQEVASVFNVNELTASTIEPFFGVNTVTKIEQETGRKIIPLIAVQTAASSAAHLTKYSNITDPLTGQKKLIVDEAIVPASAIFDFDSTRNSPEDLTIDGGLDGLSHTWEVFMGATGKPYYEMVKNIIITSTRLILKNLLSLREKSDDMDARKAICLGTDLGGYAIMVGGTNGGHLGSFSLVDILSHGRACAILNPYYTVYFCENIQDQLQVIGKIYRENGLISVEIESLDGRELAETVAKGMIVFLDRLGVPKNLNRAGATKEHVTRMLSAAKNPQLKSKLLNMPKPLDPDKGDIDHFMEPILNAAYSGDLSLIKIS